MRDDRPEYDYGEGKTLEEETRGSLIAFVIILAAICVALICIAIAARLIF